MAQHSDNKRKESRNEARSPVKSRAKATSGGIDRLDASIQSDSDILAARKAHTASLAKFFGVTTATIANWERSESAHDGAHAKGLVGKAISVQSVRDSIDDLINNWRELKSKSLKINGGVLTTSHTYRRFFGHTDEGHYGLAASVATQAQALRDDKSGKYGGVVSAVDSAAALCLKVMVSTSCTRQAVGLIQRNVEKFLVSLNKADAGRLSYLVDHFNSELKKIEDQFRATSILPK